MPHAKQLIVCWPFLAHCFSMHWAGEQLKVLFGDMGSLKGELAATQQVAPLEGDVTFLASCFLRQQLFLFWQPA